MTDGDATARGNPAGEEAHRAPGAGACAAGAEEERRAARQGAGAAGLPERTAAAGGAGGALAAADRLNPAADGGGCGPQARAGPVCLALSVHAAAPLRP